MSQCVPRWDRDDPQNPHIPVHLLPMSDSEVAELTWKNGHLAMHGLRQPEIAKPIPIYPSSSAAAAAIPATWKKPGPSGTLESIIDQATRSQLLPPPSLPSPISWPGLPLHHQHCNADTAAAAAAADALVPYSDRDDHSVRFPDPPTGKKRPRVGESGRKCASQGSTAPTAGGRGKKSTVVTLDTWEVTRPADDVGFTTTSASPDDLGFTTTSASPDDLGFTTTSASPSPEEGGGSPDTENTSFGGGRPPTLDEHDSFCHSQRYQPDEVEEEEEKVTNGEAGRSSISTKRSRASAVHNQSERKRRDRINQRMKTLQKLVPNSSKTDKASMLNEVIEYLKQLQAQVQMMGRMRSIPHMMMPMAMPQLQMSMLAHMTQMSQMGMGMGMGMGMMDMNPLGQPGHTRMPTNLYPSTFLPHLAGGLWDATSYQMQQLGHGNIHTDPFSAFCACPTQQPMGMDAFNRMAALYQQLYQQAPPANPKT